MTAGRVDRAALASENEIYTHLGRVLLEMLHPEHSDSWDEILLRVEHVTPQDAPDAYVMETTVVLRGGERLPLVARPEIMGLSRGLDQLCKEQSGRAWRSFDYRVFRDDLGPGFQCRYTYPDTTH
jgi:hypothetical protein